MLTEACYSQKTIEKLDKTIEDPVFIAVSLKRSRYINAETFKSRFEWDKRLAPSDSLLNGYKAGRISWNEYIPIFEKEMQREESQKALIELTHRAINENVVIWCFCGLIKTGTIATGF